ncbi:MAG: lysophospholipid acyltransferase family protein [Rhodospirillaceae bacterium]|jgi:Kdo2-lipid IVA lauroyltransferase/acyltransferase|nr:lysophospholipid acyltransferase family protein [Rhodospirillaceae bacterium]MBT5897782.1 lysophospholipid acyltransferase family protein [Rhodospirillaceae bacterium]MBT6426484.1 lysophospholipid acyltransferase family protein [Rhodospirillaceae bacterium]MBT7756076.1 lysophospholipid acyltransferase family protein [Rhodospirillaceae bacterium]
MKHPIRYRLEYCLARCFWALLTALPIAAASNVGAALGTAIGLLPILARRVERNLILAMPDLKPRERAAIRAGVWRNLGRTIAELPHLPDFTLTDQPPRAGQIQVIGTANLEGREGSLLFGGHLANWELMYLVTAKLGRPMHVVYRAANNPLIDQWLWHVREGSSLGALAKGASAARGILAALNKGETVGMLVDQKMNDGIEVTFFGHPAMTAPALAQLALRRNLPVIPVRCERLGGAAFRVTIHEPMVYATGNDQTADITALMGQVNDLMEDWIRARPEQWLWPHNRWPKNTPE